MVEPPLRVTLLARDAGGWARLCRVVSAAHACALGGPPVVSWEVLGRYVDEGLTVLLGPASEPVRALSAGRPDIAGQLIAPWREVAGANLRLETVWWGLPGTGPGSLRLAARTVGLADQLGIRAVLTNPVRYADPAQHRIADVLDAARLLRPIDRRSLDCGERWLNDPGAMEAAAERIAEAAGAAPGRAAALLAETVRTGEECVVDPVADLGLGRPHFPEPQVVGVSTSVPYGQDLADVEVCERAVQSLREGDPRVDITLRGPLAMWLEDAADGDEDGAVNPYAVACAQALLDVRPADGGR